MAGSPADAPAGAALRTHDAGKSRDTKIVTTLDAALQRQLEELAMNWKSCLRGARSSLAMIVDHTNMKVRGWVGSVDINDDTRFSHVDMVNAIRSRIGTETFYLRYGARRWIDPSRFTASGCPRENR